MSVDLGERSRDPRFSEGRFLHQPARRGRSRRAGSCRRPGVFVQDKDIPVGANFVEAMHEAIDIGEKTLGRQYPNVIIAVLNLIALLQQTGRDSEAAALRARYGVPENGPK
jgi:hypothetical protein